MLPFQPARACKEYQLNHAGVIQRKKTDVIVAIGGSTGSPKIVEKIISHLPADLPAAIMVSLHMPAGFTASYADRLDQTSLLQVKEAAEKDPLLEGIVLIAPGDYHLVVRKRAVTLSSAPKVHYVRPAIDVMLESLAFSIHRVVAVILSGMGKDGTAGVEILKKQKPGSIVIVQDPQSSVISSMPKSIIDSGFFDEVVSLSRITGRIVLNVQALMQNSGGE